MGMSRRNSRGSPLARVGAAAAMIVASATCAIAQDFVGGSTPDRRPASAPTIKSFERAPDWMAKARRGISEPYPASLRFLEDQGGWFTPFTRPNMPGPYDIRELYGTRGAVAKPGKGAN